MSPNTNLAPISFAVYREKTIPKISLKAAQSVLELAAEGGTVPFIARYRKEKTGGLDEVEIRHVIEANETLTELNKRREFVFTEIHTQGNLTDELKKRIEQTFDLGDLEEIYRPFKKKKKTKATLAREAGLEPLGDWLWKIGHGEETPAVTMEIKAKDFLNIAGGIVTYDLALKGAQDIIVEKLSNDAGLRERIRQNFFDLGKITSKKAKGFKAHSKFEMYAEFAEPVKSLAEKKASHRYLAMRRGWAEEELTVAVEGDEAANLQLFERTTFLPAVEKAVAGNAEIGKVLEFLKTCAKLAYTVHVHPSISNEVHRVLKDNADKDAITVFAENVRKVLLSSPFGPRCVLGVDPGLRTGCKVALIDKQGTFISNTVLHILGEAAHEKAKTLFAEVTKQIAIDAIAVGNGTGGREAETFIRKVLKEIEKEIPVILVSESGASVYSASDVAREEFPDLDLTIRGAISIARRLQDPLAELVKVDPKSIGVGQYQHDVSQTALKKSLGEVVESCVNGVGVDLNTASAPLLSYVAGIGPALAKSIVDHRRTNGLFMDRDQLLKVTRFSPKVFEQCAGFLRVPQGKHPLDSTGVHPERYAAVRDMAAELSVPVTGLFGENAKKILALRTKWAQIIGEFTFDDIIRELEKPGRDPRDPFKIFAFRDDIFDVKDLKEGMICPGIVTNVTNFGAFVDIGVHQDGLVHISELSTKFVDDPRKVVNPGDQVTIRVLGVDLEKTQVSLSMILEAGAPRERAARGEAAPRAERAPRGDRAPRGEKTARAPREPKTPPPMPTPGPRVGGPQVRDPNAPAPQAGTRPTPRGPGMIPAAGSGPRPSDNRDGGRANERGSERGFSGGPRPHMGNDRGGGGAGNRGGGFGGGSPFNNPFAALLTNDSKNSKNK